MWFFLHPFLKTAVLLSSLILFLAPLVFSVSLSLLWTSGIIAIGLFILLFWLLDHFYLGMALTPSYEMQRHMYEPAATEGAKLFYFGDVPVLDLEEPTCAGRAEGLLLCKGIHALRRRWNFVQKLIRRPKEREVLRTLKRLQTKIPSSILEEMSSLATAFNQTIKKEIGFRIRPITEEELLLFHLLADILYFDPREQPPSDVLVTPGCTVIAEQSEAGMIFARNMDWPTLGISGAYTLVIKRKGDGYPTAEIGLPGLVGTLTGMNAHGLCLAMNVCAGNPESVEELIGKNEGIPALFFNRMCLQQCRSIEDVDAFLNHYMPLGPYHLTVADQKGAKSYHFFQNSGKDRSKPSRSKHMTRSLEDKPLIVTNQRYDLGWHRHRSKEREEIIRNFLETEYENTPKERVLEECLALPYVNNLLTMHKIMMFPNRKEISVAFDNAYAGQRKLHHLPASLLFPPESAL